MSPPRVLVVTTMNAAGYAQHGERMVASAAQFWGEGIALRVYAEDFAPDPRHLHVDWQDLHQVAPWLAPFKLRCEAQPERCGRMPGGGYDFRMDARKFSHKVAALTAAGIDLAGGRDRPGLFCWMDADTVTHAPVTAQWLCDLVPPDCVLGWLERDRLYPECGFLAFRPAHPDFGGLMLRFRDLYARDDVFRLREWHDSFALQRLVQGLQVSIGLRVVSLSGDARRHSHPFINGPLGQAFDHLKGPRKEAGRSRRSDLMRPRAERYWQPGEGGG